MFHVKRRAILTNENRSFFILYYSIFIYLITSHYNPLPCVVRAFCYALFWAGRKIVQIGQTEPKGYPKSYISTMRGEVCSKHKAIKKEEIRDSQISSVIIILFYSLTQQKYFIILFLCLVWYAHFTKATILFFCFSYNLLSNYCRSFFIVCYFI